MLREQILRTILKKFWIVFRNLKSFFALLLMDTSLPQNESLIIRIKRETVGSGLFEAFLESAPQLILQCSIILRTGNLSYHFNASNNGQITVNFHSHYELFWMIVLSSKLLNNKLVVCLALVYFDCLVNLGDF